MHSEAGGVDVAIVDSGGNLHAEVARHNRTLSDVINVATAHAFFFLFFFFLFFFF